MEWIAVDLGASNGRTIPGRFYGGNEGELPGHSVSESGLSSAPEAYGMGFHNTASAVSCHAWTPNYAFISSGTWLLIGVVADNAIINDAVYPNKFSNEGTVGRLPSAVQHFGAFIQSCKRNGTMKLN